MINHSSLILGQINAPEGIAAWLACAAFVLMLGKQGLRLKERLLGEKRAAEIFPQPLEVKTAPHLATREYCDSNSNAAVRRIKAIEQELSDLRNERREAAAKLEEKIEIAGRDINELERRLNAVNEARFEKVHTRINEVLGEIRELRGALKIRGH